MLMLAGIVHGVDLGHTAGQVSEEPRSDLGVDTFAGGKEPSDFIHAFTESGAIFSQNGGICVQSSCRANGEVRLSQVHISVQTSEISSDSDPQRRLISPGCETYRSSEPSGGSGDVSPSSPGCPPSPAWSVWSSERTENTHG